jgi:hypothetical protein
MWDFVAFLVYIELLSVALSVKSGFSPGRIAPGRFEYPANNGWMLPEEAVKICENDEACAGFTFRGAFRVKSKTVEIYFFNFVQPTKTLTHTHWSSYRVKGRNYVKIPMEISELSEKSVKSKKHNLMTKSSDFEVLPKDTIGIQGVVTTSKLNYCTVVS